MTGLVDDGLRALLRVPVSALHDGERKEIVVWIDTAFIGALTIPRSQIAELGLGHEASGKAILADGNVVEVELFTCFIDWFGSTYRTQIAATEGMYPLLGTVLLNGRRLDIDYRTKTVELT